MCLILDEAASRGPSALADTLVDIQPVATVCLVCM